ncbi:hypothetical protein ACFQ1I_20845 [Kitasatospora arboriphila]
MKFSVSPAPAASCTQVACRFAGQSPEDQTRSPLLAVTVSVDAVRPRSTRQPVPEVLRTVSENRGLTLTVYELRPLASSSETWEAAQAGRAITSGVLVGGWPPPVPPPLPVPPAADPSVPPAVLPVPSELPLPVPPVERLTSPPEAPVPPAAAAPPPVPPGREVMAEPEGLAPGVIDWTGAACEVFFCPWPPPSPDPVRSQITSAATTASATSTTRRRRQ